MRAGCTPPGSSTTRELAEAEPRLARDRRPGGGDRARGRGRPLARSSGCSATSAARSTPAARATTRSRPRSGSTSRMPARRRAPGIAALAGAVLDRAEADAETPMPGYTHLQRAQPVTVGHHLLAWVEMLERDLAPLRGRRGGGRGQPARRRCARRLDAPAARARAAAAQLARRGRRPRLRARLPLRGRGLLRPSLADRRGARPLDDRRVRLRRARRRRRRPARR